MNRAGRLASAAAPWALPASAIATVVLGVWGWLDYGYRFDHALYRAVALFSINNEIYREAPAGTDLRFLIGRWTGLLAVFGAALFALAALLREQATVAFALLVKRRVAVIGAGDVALKAFESARLAARPCVWIGAPALDARRLSAFAVPWPAEDQERAVRTHVANGARSSIG